MRPNLSASSSNAEGIACCQQCLIPVAPTLANVWSSILVSAHLKRSLGLGMSIIYRESEVRFHCRVP